MLNNKCRLSSAVLRTLMFLGDFDIVVALSNHLVVKIDNVTEMVIHDSCRIDIIIKYNFVILQWQENIVYISLCILRN